MTDECGMVVLSEQVTASLSRFQTRYAAPRLAIPLDLREPLPVEVFFGNDTQLDATHAMPL